MRATAGFCREQEAIQRAKAANEPLENRRTIALNAAKAWAAEAKLAEKRDAKTSTLDKLDTAIAEEFAREGQGESDA